MSWFKNVFARSDVPTADDEIDEELMTHFRLLVDEQLAKGVAFDDAWRAAEERFGPMRRYSNACRRASLGGWLASQKLPAAGLAAVALLVGWLIYEVRTLHQDQARLLTATPQAVVNHQRPAQASNFRGTILDDNGEPLAEVRMLVILKTWPGGRYRQQDFTTISDAEGRFRIAGLLPANGDFAVHVAALKDGFALESFYQIIDADNDVGLGPIKLELQPAAAVTLVVHDADGRPIPGVGVMPHGRHSPKSDKYHAIYFQAGKPAQIAADANGQVVLSCFQRGDRAQIYVQPPGEDWHGVSFAIPEQGDLIEVTTGKPRDDRATKAEDSRT